MHERHLTFSDINLVKNSRIAQNMSVSAWKSRGEAPDSDVNHFAWLYVQCGHFQSPSGDCLRSGLITLSISYSTYLSTLPSLALTHHIKRTLPFIISNSSVHT